MAKKQCCFNPKGHNLFLPNTDFVCFFCVFYFKSCCCFCFLEQFVQTLHVRNSYLPRGQKGGIMYATIMHLFHARTFSSPVDLEHFESPKGNADGPVDRVDRPAHGWSWRLNSGLAWHPGEGGLVSIQCSEPGSPWKSLEDPLFHGWFFPGCQSPRILPGLGWASHIASLMSFFLGVLGVVSVRLHEVWRPGKCGRTSWPCAAGPPWRRVRS